MTRGYVHPNIQAFRAQISF